MKTKFKLGMKVWDTLTGFEGIIGAVTFWQFGCTRITIDPCTLDKDGKVNAVQDFDEQRIEIIRKRPMRKSKDSKPRARGGPKPTVTRW